MTRKFVSKYVYLFHAILSDEIAIPDTHIFKIGISKNVYQRQKQIRLKTFISLKCLENYFSNTAREDEKNLHKLFEHRLIEGTNEWFKFESTDQAITLFNDYFIMKKQYFPDYQNILMELISSHWAFLELVTELIVVKDKIAVIQVNSSNPIIFALVESLRVSLENAFKKNLDKPIQVVFTQVNEQNTDKNIVFDTETINQFIRLFLEANDKHITEEDDCDESLDFEPGWELKLF